MKRLGTIIVLLLVLLVGGSITAQLTSDDDSNLIGTTQQTNDPNASVSELVPWKAEQLFLLVGFILFNLIGIAVTLMLIFWLLDRQVRTVKASVPAPRGGEAQLTKADEAA